MITYASLVIGSNPISYYRLSETAGPTATDQMGANNGTYTGGVTFSQPPLIDSDISPCIKLDGSTGYVLCKSGRILSGLVNCSIVAWVKTTAAVAFDLAIYGERAAAGNDIFKMDMLASPSFKLELVYRDDAGTLNRPASTAGVLNDGLRHQVAVTKAGTAIVLYQDGVQAGVGTLTATNTFTDASVQSRIGADIAGGASTNWPDYIDEVALYSYALPAGAVLSQYQAGITSTLFGDYSKFPKRVLARAA